MQIRLAETLHEVAGPLIAEAIQSGIARRGRCRLALSGGSTPVGTLRWLADNLPRSVYPHLWVTWADERLVPVDDPRSNAGLAATEWFDRAMWPAVNIEMVSDPALELAAARDAYAARFRQHFDGGLDVALLGAGGDGHTASLFPGHPALASTRRVEAVSDSPKPPPERLTLTLPVLIETEAVFLLARGAGKAPALAAAWAGAAPLGRLPQAVWILDRAAAARLPTEAIHDNITDAERGGEGR